MSIAAGAPAPTDRPAEAPLVQVARGNPAPQVLVAGLVTTVLALAGVWALSVYADENVMGWYANFVIPVGAVLVGAVASIGFGLGSWLTGARISGRLLAAVALSLVAGYWAAKWVEFRVAFPNGATFDDGTPAGFLDWYDLVTRSFAWKDRGGKVGAPLGAWGYLLRAGEILGFAAGGLITPFALRRVPYCTSCAMYMRQPVVAVVPAGVKPRRVSKKDAAGQAAYEAETREAFARGEAAVAKLLAAAQAGNPAAFAAAVAEGGPMSGRRAAEKLTARLHVRVVHCRRCAAGELRVALATGQGQNLKTQPLQAETLMRGVAPRLLAKA